MSVFNIEHNIIFVHVPKTAGSSMEDSYFIGGSGHHTAFDYKTVLKPEAWENAFKFAFIRNPYSRFVSAYFHDGNGLKKSKEDFRKFAHKLPTVQEVTSVEYKRASFPIHHHFLPQWLFVLGKDAEILVNFIGRFEHIEKDWKEVCERAEVKPFELSKSRVGSYGDWEDYYTPDIKKIVENYYKRDFELFNIIKNYNA